MRRMLVWALLFCAHAAAADPRSAAVRTLSYPDGPRVLLAPDSLAAAVHVGVWYEAGSRNDPRGRAGLAYVVGRSALALTPDARRALDAVGASFDLTVTPDLTASGVTLPPEQLRTALEAIATQVAAPAVDESALRQGREAARIERSRRLARTPLLIGIEKVCASLFAGHGYAAPASGLDADLEAITLEQVQRDVGSRFTRARALITVTGRFDADEALAMLQSHFGSPGPAAALKPAAATFGDVVPHADAGTTPLPVSVVLAGWRLPPERDRDAVALDVLERLIAEGANGRLEQALVSRGGPFLRTQGNFERRGDACVFVVAAAVEGMIDTASVESRLTTEVERWGREPIAAADLESAKRAVEADLLVRFQTASGRAEALATAQLVDGDWQAWEQRLQWVRELKPKDVQAAASRSLVPARRAIVWTAPTLPAEGGRP
jgi:zinc protease